MRHRKKKKILSRKKSHRIALLRNQTLSLIENGKIRTTEAKAKLLRPFVERLITIAKKDTLANRRKVLRYLPHLESVKKLFSEIAPKYKDRPGGYLRIIKLKKRFSDGALIVEIQFV